jgi:hypothetical protein
MSVVSTPPVSVRVTSLLSVVTLPLFILILNPPVGAIGRSVLVSGSIVSTRVLGELGPGDVFVEKNATREVASCPKSS